MVWFDFLDAGNQATGRRWTGNRWRIEFLLTHSRMSPASVEVSWLSPVREVVWAAISNLPDLHLPTVVGCKYLSITTNNYMDTSYRI